MQSVLKDVGMVDKLNELTVAKTVGKKEMFKLGLTQTIN